MILDEDIQKLPTFRLLDEIVSRLQQLRFASSDQHEAQRAEIEVVYLATVKCIHVKKSYEGCHVTPKVE